MRVAQNQNARVGRKTAKKMQIHSGSEESPGERKSSFPVEGKARKWEEMLQEREDERGVEGGDDSLERSYQKGLSIKTGQMLRVI